jgi:hypothetical protein
MRFNAAPGWPVPPPGWGPPAGWQPDPSWPPAPTGWQFWLSGEDGRDSGVPGAVGKNPASDGTHPDAQPAGPDLARVWVAEITRLAERRRTNTVSRVTLIAPPVKGGLLGKIVAIGVGAALGGGINDAALDAADQAHDAHGAVRLPDTCLLCGLLPGAVTDTADITIDASTLGFFLGGELLSQQKVTLSFRRCRECATETVRPARPLVIESYRRVGDAWLASLLFLNDRVAESVRVLNRAHLITARRCLKCGYTDDDQAWLAREDVCPVCHTLYAGGRAWLCPQCGKNLPIALLAKPRKPSTRRQALWGGVDCPRCGADVPKP